MIPKKRKRPAKAKRKQCITRMVLERTTVWLSCYIKDGAQVRYQLRHRRFASGGHISYFCADDFESFAPSLKLKPGQCVRCVKIDTDKGFFLERDE